MRGNLWSDDAPGEDQPLDLVVYRSRLIGSDPELVLWGGGNTSVKTMERDHLERERPVLRVKGSGTNLKSIDRSGFPGVFRDDILHLLERETMSDEEMTSYVEHCMVETGGHRPSVETLLHGFIPAKHVDHVHADAIVALTNAPDGCSAVRDALGDRVACVPYRRPGFDLARLVYEAARRYDAVVLEKHGLVTWGDTAQQSYTAMIELVERAETWLRNHEQKRTPRSETDREPVDMETVLLRLRGRLGRVILHPEVDSDIKAIAGRSDIEAIANAGPATPDHVLRIRPWACVLDPTNPAASVDQYVDRYRRWFEAYSGGRFTMLSPLPKVFLVPGAGMVTAGRHMADALIAAEVARHTLAVAARGTDIHGAYQPVGDRGLFDVEYWPLELYKLSLDPAPREFEGHVIVVTGAGSGIGRSIARLLGTRGAQLALLDINSHGLDKTATMICESDGNQPLCLTIDLTDEDAVAGAVSRVIGEFGGIDGLVSNAGIPAGGTLDQLTPDEWRRSMDVNATSHFLVTAAVMRAMRTQGAGGSLVYIASKNAFGPGAGFGAYSAAKAAQVQLARIAALEGGPYGIRSNIINPDAIFEDSGLWSDEVRRARAAAHGVPVEELEDFYAQRNLLKTHITGTDVAEAAAFLLGDRSHATTGTVIAVDGGVPGAFPR